MSNGRVALFLFAAAAAISQSSCVIRARPVHEVTVVESGPPPAEVVVTEAPPAAQVEVIPVAPSPNHVWVGGYWARHGNSWFWVSGAYYVRPAHRTHWEPGHWEARGRHWVWVPGHWV